MTIYKGLLLFLIGASFFSSQSAFSFSFSLDKNQVQVGEIASLRIWVPFSKGSERPLVFDELLTRHKKLKVLEQQAQKVSNGHQLIFELTAYEPNEYLIPPVQIKIGSDTFSTEALPLTVTTSRQKDDIEIRPEFELLKKPFPWRKVYAAAMWFLVAAVLAWLFRWALTKISLRNYIAFFKRFSFPKFESRKAWLRREIHRLQKRLASEAQLNDVLDDAFFTLKKYLEKNIHQPVPAWTQRELQTRIQSLLIKRKLTTICTEIDRLQYHTPDKTQIHQRISDLLVTMKKELL